MQLEDSNHADLVCFRTLLGDETLESLRRTVIKPTDCSTSLYSASRPSPHGTPVVVIDIHKRILGNGDGETPALQC